MLRTAARPVWLGLAIVLGAWNSAEAASLRGTVADQSGAAVPHAEIFLATEPYAVAGRKARSDAEGRFSFAGLASGNYILTVEAPGFQVFSQLDVRVGDQAEVELPTVVMQIADGCPTYKDTPRIRRMWASIMRFFAGTPPPEIIYCQ